MTAGVGIKDIVQCTCTFKAYVQHVIAVLKNTLCPIKSFLNVDIATETSNSVHKQQQ